MVANILVHTVSYMYSLCVMGHNNHHLLNFHLPHMGKKEASAEEFAVPTKGCLAVKVGKADEEQQKFLVPMTYLNHPLFLSLLKAAEDEYGYDHNGAITIPCHVEHFRQLQSTINRDSHHGHHHPHLMSCFRV